MEDKEKEDVSLSLDFIRRCLKVCTLFTTIICTIIEIGAFLYYFFTDTIRTNVTDYVIMRMIVPSAINIGLTVFSLCSAKSKKLPAEWKDFIASTCYMLILCCISINHAVYMVLWIAPMLAVTVCLGFEKNRLIIHLSGIAILNVFASAAYLASEYPENIPLYVQVVVVSVVVDVVLLQVDIVMSKHQKLLREETKEHLEKELEYERKLHFDYLTGLHSREHITRISEESLINCTEEKPVSVSILDLDDFKRINDNYGHSSGDVVLKAVAEVLRSHADSDLHAGRFGGEEFILCSKNKSKEQIREILTEIQEEICGLRFDFTGEKITVSGGSFFTDRYIPYSDVFIEADKLLYEAKNRGKNRISFN